MTQPGDGQIFAPISVSHEKLTEILTDILERVRAHDSFEGYIEYTPSPRGERLFDVLANYRICDNLSEPDERTVGQWVMTRMPKHAGSPGQQR